MTTTTTATTTDKPARQVPSGTMAALATMSAHNFFDPIDLLEDKLGAQPSFYSRVMESMTWMLDSSCISQARTVLFERYKEVDQLAPDAFKGFCQDVAENLAHESLYNLEAESNELTLAILMSLRNHWHDAAAHAASTDDHDYKSKSLRELMESEKPKAADIGTRINYRALADQEAAGDKAKADRLYAAYMEADALASTNRVDKNKELMPTLLEVLRTVSHYAAESYRFDQLPLTVQKRLTVFAVGAIQRTKLDMAKKLNKQPIAFGHMCEAAYQAELALNVVITTKFSDTGELENVKSQVQTDMDKSAKRKAICSID